jgi:hypothetical protein
VSKEKLKFFKKTKAPAPAEKRLKGGKYRGWMGEQFG